jgi:hypothetical protein
VAGALTYTWSATAGYFQGSGPSVSWVAPDIGGAASVTVTVSNLNGSAVHVESFDVVVALPQGDLSGAVPMARRVAAASTGDLAVADAYGALYLLTRDGRMLAAPQLTEQIAAVAGGAGVFFASTTSGDVLVIDAAGARITRRIRLGMSTGPTGLSWDAARQVLWMAWATDGLQAITLDGTTVQRITTAGGYPLNQVVDVAVDVPAAKVWVVQAYRDSGVPLLHAFDVTTGNHLASTMVRGNALGQVMVAGGVAVDSASRVYVSDAFSYNVQVLAADGTPAAVLGTGLLNQPTGLAHLANGDLVVANMQNGTLARFGTGVQLPTCAGDSNCDGVSDAYAIAHGMDPMDSTWALGDDDHDGLTNREELALGTNPGSADTDGDGVSDLQEILTGFNPLDPNDHRILMMASGPVGDVDPGEVRLSSAVSASAACSPALAWTQRGGPTVSLRGATGTAPSFIARAAGTYVFEGVASCGGFASRPATVSINVRNVAPRADADRVAVVAAGERTQLSGAFSSDANGDTLSLGWEQTVGPALLATATGPTLALRTGAPGYHAFRLTAADAAGQVGTAEVPMMVVDPRLAAPTAYASVETAAPVAAAPVALLADGLGAGFAWEQVGGPAVQLAVEPSGRATFTPASAGRYTFQLSATDGLIRSIPSTVDVFVAADAVAGLPTAVVARAAAPVAIETPVTLDGTASHGSAALTYSWRQVSGPAAALSDADRPTATMVAFVPGSYLFELTVTDNGVVGIPATVRLEARASGRAIPVARAATAGTALVGELVRLDGRASTGARHFRWTQVFGPWVALPAGQSAPAFVPTAPGLYTFELEVDDGATRSAPASVSILVGTP